MQILSKFRLEAAGINRIRQWLETCDCATISAFRGYSGKAIEELGQDGFNLLTPEEKAQYAIPRSVNMRNTALLRSKITALGYGYIQIKGMFQEATASKPQGEVSFLVFDKDHKGALKKDILKLGNLFEQDSITYAPAGGNFSELETTPFYAEPGKGRHGPTGDVIARYTGVRVERYIHGEEPSEKEFLRFYSQIRNHKFAWDKREEVKYKPVEVESMQESPLTAMRYPSTIKSFITSVNAMTPKWTE